MFYALTTSHFERVKAAVRQEPRQVLHTAMTLMKRLAKPAARCLIHGPVVLLTSRITVKCATLMVMLCMPSLIFCGILTLPQFLFESPHESAYGFFSRLINEDPSRWAVLFLTAVCAVLALAVPAVMPKRDTSYSY